MWKKILIFAAVIMLAVPAYAEDDFDDDFDDAFLDDYMPADDYDYEDDFLDGDIATGVAEFSLLDGLPNRLSLNANSSFVNVNDFDIAGIMLSMPFESVRILFFREAAVYTPAKKSAIVYSIPQEWRFNLDYECRQQKIFAPKELEKCINTAAKKRGLLYPSEMRLERPATGEKIKVFFTSNATDNVVWKVEYSNDVNDVPGDDKKFTNQRDKKVLAFWQMILEKYGAPNSGGDIWAASDNPTDPFMRAGYGELLLIYQWLRNRDEMDNVNDSRERFRSKPYSF